LRYGAGLSDAVLLRAAWQASGRDDDFELLRVAAIGAALVPSAEIAQQTAAQGEAFLAAVGEAWPAPILDRLADHGRRIVFPVAVGVTAAAHAVPLEASVTAYLSEFSANLVSAGMRLIPLGQRDGQRAIAALEPVIDLTRLASSLIDMDTVGTTTPAADIASMRHETQYTRLFRS
jgi:urease accessory protein